jgi:perosamine synthetase
LRKLRGWVERRRAIAKRYDEAFSTMRGIHPLRVNAGVEHAYHIYPVLVDGDRAAIFTALREEGIGCNVHYIPVHLHPFYKQRFGTGLGLCPVAEAAYERLITLPVFPAMTGDDVESVVDACAKVLAAHDRSAR